ncbi:MAG: hypothetical protein AAF218_06620 [Pseudomonadota bacterium]
MLETKDHFNSRLRGLNRKHTAMRNGYVTQLRGDGLIVITPRRARRGMPMKGMLLLAIGFFAFKAFVLISIGDASYEARLQSLRAGTMAEQAGAWALQVDPVTAALAQSYATFAQ